MRNRSAKQRYGIRAVQLGAKEARLKLRRTSFVRVCFQQTRLIERVRSRARLIIFSKAETSEKIIIRRSYVSRASLSCVLWKRT